jgi:hypothetical protein
LRTELRTTFQPWLCFIWFTLANAVLSYIPLSFTLKSWVFLLGLALPLFLLFSTQPPLSPSAYKNPPFLLEDSLGTRLTQPWAWFTFVILAAVLRFWDIGSLNRWPGGDSSLMALSVIQWMDHLQWKPFVTLSQAPSTIVYLFYFSAKLTGSFLYGIQLPSSLISFLTLFFAYATARLYFPRSLSWILGTLVAFDEWDLLLSRSDEAGVLLPFWEWGVLYLLGRLTLAKTQSSRIAWACGLGLTLGAGPYTFMAWPILVVFVFGVSLVWFWKKAEVAAGGFFLLCLMVALIPFLKAAWQEGYGGHLHDVAVWSDPAFSWIQQVQVAIGYIQAVFWGGTTGMEMAPDGGFLNVFLGSFFILGFLEIFRFRRLFLSRFLLIPLPLFLLPGLLTRDLEAHRILLILPILLLFVSVGIRSLLLSFPERFRLILLVGILGTSAWWDLTRLFHPWEFFSHPSSEATDTNEYRNGYRILESQAKEKGPGWFFSDMLPNTFDYSLAYCSYSFNAAWNPRLGQDVKWAAVFTESHYLPFLSKVFPSCRWVIAPTQKAGVLSRHAFGLIGVTPENRPILARWKTYYSFQQEINLETVDIPTGISHQVILEKMLRAYPLIPEDPFLQSCYFEKMVFNYSSEKVFHPKDTWANWSNFSEVFRISFFKSYQDVELCEKYGRLLAVEGQKTEAKRIFEKALRLFPGNPWLKSEIQQLGLSG